ncbi:MAG: acyl-CoA dehydrogenase family protein [Xanthomonas sp.]
MLERFLQPAERESLLAFDAFSAQHVAHFADAWDQRESVDTAVIAALAERGWLGGVGLPENGGKGFSATVFGLLNMAVGTGSASLTGLLNVHTMVLASLERWGTPHQRNTYLAAMAAGKLIGAFAQTETEAGGDARNLSTQMRLDGDTLVIDGAKTWITFAQHADVFLVFGKLNGLDTAALVARDTPGLEVRAQSGMLGFRSAHLAAVHLSDCRLPASCIVGKPGFGQSLISGGALNYGRLSVAWAAVGLHRAALAAAAHRASNRRAFGTLLVDQGIVRGYLADMSSSLLASELICLSASRAFDAREEDAVEQILQAKLVASENAATAASRAMQIHGGYGCQESAGVSRLYRDAKILQIVEGSNELQKMLIGEQVGRRYRALAPLGASPPPPEMCAAQ